MPTHRILFFVLTSGILLGSCKSVVLPPATLTLTPKTYLWKAPDSIGSYKGITIHLGGLSGLDYIPGSNMEFWAVTDRGCNVDASEKKEDAIVFPVAKFSPLMVHFRLEGDSLHILEEVPLKRPDGTPASGLPPEVGHGGTGELGWADANGPLLKPDPWGADCEGIAQGIAGNDMWVSEEYGTSIWHVEKATGTVIQRFTPVPAMPQDRPIDSVFRMREPNKGFECMTVTPSGKVIAIVQSPMSNPDEETGKASRIHRILSLDPSTGKTQMFAYVHEAPTKGIKRYNLGDLCAINDTEFLVIEHAAKNGENTKRLWKINLAEATPVTLDNFEGKTLEALNDSVGLSSHHIRPVAKSMYFDLIANGWDPTLDKPEGVTILNDTTIAVLNDNDFGVASENSSGNMALTGTPSRVYVWTLPPSMKLNYVPRKIRYVPRKIRK